MDAESEKRIARAEELDRLAAPGPWTRQNHPAELMASDGYPVAECCRGTYENDAAFIAESRALLPALAADAKSLKDEGDHLRKRLNDTESELNQARSDIQHVRTDLAQKTDDLRKIMASQESFQRFCAEAANVYADERDMARKEREQAIERAEKLQESGDALNAEVNALHDRHHKQQMILKRLIDQHKMPFKFGHTCHAETVQAFIEHLVPSVAGQQKRADKLAVDLKHNIERAEKAERERGEALQRLSWRDEECDRLESAEDRIANRVAACTGALDLVRQYQAACARWTASKDPRDEAEVARLRGQLAIVKLPKGGER